MEYIIVLLHIIVVSCMIITMYPLLNRNTDNKLDHNIEYHKSMFEAMALIEEGKIIRKQNNTLKEIDNLQRKYDKTGDIKYLGMSDKLRKEYKNGIGKIEPTLTNKVYNKMQKKKIN